MDFHMLHRQGLSIHKIADLRGVSRNTVRRALRSAAPPTGKRRRSKGIALEPYVSQIDAWLRDEVKSRWTVERMFDELQELGYRGGRTLLKEHVRTHRPQKPKMGEARFFVNPVSSSKSIGRKWVRLTSAACNVKSMPLSRSWLGRVRYSSASRPTCNS